MKTTETNFRKRLAAVLLTAALFVGMFPVLGGELAPAASAASITASGTVNDNDVNMRSAASTSSKIVTTLKKGTKVTIQNEVFTHKTSNAATKRWYYVTAGTSTGYIRTDLVSNVSFGNTTAMVNDDLNFRKGPATSFGKLGTVSAGTPVTLLLPASLNGSGETWYKAVVNGTDSYVCGDYVSIGAVPQVQAPPADLSGKSDIARALLSTPSIGGKARVVYTFNTGNCKKLFAIKGYKKAKVPQGLAFTGNEYYILYGMAAGQSVVRYSAGGQRLGASKFAFSIGHPNGITYDPVTNLCYIFKGNTKKFYTWSPSTNQFGKAKGPYSSSGIAYDNASNMLYATSRSGVRVYSADGSFTHQKLFPRCSHGIFHYTQDCGAGEGFIFHGISGSNKKKTNYLDIYRASDSAYLGSIKVSLGEIESAVVGNDGYLQLLINTMGKDTDYIWRTPLNVRELKF